MNIELLAVTISEEDLKNAFKSAAHFEKFYNNLLNDCVKQINKSIIRKVQRYYDTTVIENIINNDIKTTNKPQ